MLTNSLRKEINSDNDLFQLWFEVRLKSTSVKTAETILRKGFRISLRFILQKLVGCPHPAA